MFDNITVNINNNIFYDNINLFTIKSPHFYQQFKYTKHNYIKITFDALDYHGPYFSLKLYCTLLNIIY